MRYHIVGRNRRARSRHASWSVCAALLLACGLGLAAEANPYQVEVLNRWWSGDNSIRHLLVHFQASVPASGQSIYTLRHGSTDIVDIVVKESVGVGALLYPVSAVIPLPRGVYFDTAGFSVAGVPDPGESVHVTEDGSSITVTTGPVRFTVNKTNFNLLDTVWFDGNGDRQYASGERVILPDNGVTSFHGGVFDGCRVSGSSCVQSLQRDRSMPAPTCVVEENGPARAVVRCERLTNYVDADDNGTAEVHEHGYAVRIYAYAGNPDVKIDYQLQNAAKGSDLTQERFADPLYFNSLDLQWNLELSAPTVRVGRHNDTVYSQLLGNGVYLAQESDDVYTIRNAASGSTLENCSTTDVCQPYGWIDATDASRGVFATIRNFWQMWPNGLEIDGTGKLAFQLWPSWSSMWRENQSPPRFSSSGVYWLEDMQAAYKEVLLHFHDGSMTDAERANLAKTFQYHPVPTLDNTWYEATAVTLDFDGHHALTSPSHPTTRLYDWCANDAQSCDRSAVYYRMGWDNFWMESPSRKESPDSGGGYPPVEEFFIASESPHHYWRTEASALGELNIRPQWLPGFDYDTEWGTLKLESNGDTLRDQNDTADYPLPDSGRDAKKWGDEHAWMYHVEDAYYVTGNLWIRDHYEFIGQFRRRRLKSHPGPGGVYDGYSNAATRAAAHTLHNALEAYRITGDTETLEMIGDYLRYRLFPEHDPRCGNRRIDVGWNIECSSPGETAAPWEGGFLMRTLIDIMGEVDRHSSVWATAFQMASAWATYNEQYGRFANRLDCVTPAPCGVTASQSEGNSHTVPDPVMWYYWNTGLVSFRNDVEDYMDGGINGGSPPYYSDNWIGDWNGDFHNRYRDWALAQSRPDATPPAAVGDLVVSLFESTATLTWSPPTGAVDYHIVWSDKPIAAAYTSDPGFTNWWGANVVDPGLANPGGTAVTVSGAPVFFALFSFDAAGNMSGMSNVASDAGGGADDTPPTVPTGLTANAQSESSIALSWNAASDPESGISHYRIFRDGSYAGQATALSWTETGLAEGTSYDFAVSAVNGVGLESGQTAPVTATTLADTQPPALVSASSAGDPTRVTVVFNEPVEQTSATDPGNYSIDNGITVSGATLGSDQTSVTLQTSAHAEGILYTLAVSGVRDQAAAPNTIAPGSQASYSFSPQLIVSSLLAASGAPYEVAEALAIGSPAYVDRSFTYSQIPAELAGATYIRTANDDKLSQGDSFLSFEVNQAVTVYVAHDDRYAVKPAWLQSFTDSGQDLQINETFSAYGKDFSAGTVQLGGNVNPVEAEGNNMYTVILVPAAPPTVPPPPPQDLRAE